MVTYTIITSCYQTILMLRGEPMQTLAAHEMGEVIRKVRKERNLRLEDLADQNISPATVSNIERGVTGVSSEKITYLLKKLNISPTQASYLFTKEQDRFKEIEFKLQVIHSLYKMNLVDEALVNIKELHVDENHPLASHLYYHMGKCYALLKKWNKAEKALLTGLRILKEYPCTDNMEPAIYLILGISSYLQNNLEQALIYTNNGISTLSPEKKNMHIKYDLYCNKGIFLQRLNRNTEGICLIRDIWKEVHLIEDIKTLLTLYWLRAEFSRVSGLLDEATDFALKGLDIASRNEQFHSMCDLWTVLGTVYTTTQKWQFAEIAFSMALKLENYSKKDKRLIAVHLSLGLLYMAQSKNKDAYESLSTAIHYAEEHNDFPRLSTALITMGNLCQSMNNKEDAIHFYNKALHLVTKYRYVNKELNIWLGLAQCYDGEDKNQFDNCMQQMYHAQKYFMHPEVKTNEHQI